MEETVAPILMTPIATKASGSDKINFQILQIIWGWEKTQIRSRIYYTITLGYHATEWKSIREILFQKGEKQDVRLFRFDSIICLLNYISKVVKKVVGIKFSYYCEELSKLDSGQI